MTNIKLYHMRADLLAKLETVLAVPGDINGDGVVDVIDLLDLIGSFGMLVGQPGCDPACDLNGDGAVDVLDLLTLIECWPK